MNIQCSKGNAAKSGQGLAALAMLQQEDARLAGWSALGKRQVIRPGTEIADGNTAPITREACGKFGLVCSKCLTCTRGRRTAIFDASCAKLELYCRADQRHRGYELGLFSRVAKRWSASEVQVQQGGNARQDNHCPVAGGKRARKCRHGTLVPTASELQPDSLASADCIRIAREYHHLKRWRSAVAMLNFANNSHFWARAIRRIQCSNLSCAGAVSKL
ncbi:hypothetical protein NA57DRAFT_54110 [Rhizodiscina lignyota]|uniref:Uncharacterized protein n=1 Tax=Rhizodiscina lignyota TaxID=1504668 RepID=A0A9P4IIC3_9PEZI|nr:hypothetical protein NA57DRAFT_54110 [Rhizodiscina lignyota]